MQLALFVHPLDFTRHLISGRNCLLRFGVNREGGISWTQNHRHPVHKGQEPVCFMVLSFYKEGRELTGSV